MKQTEYLELEKPESGDAVDVSVLDSNFDKIDSNAKTTNIRLDTLYRTLPVYYLEADSAENPTNGTPAACAGVMLEIGTDEDADVGLRLFAGTSGVICMSAKRDENTWHDWSKIAEPDSRG